MNRIPPISLFSTNAGPVIHRNGIEKNLSTLDLATAKAVDCTFNMCIEGYKFVMKKIKNLANYSGIKKFMTSLLSKIRLLFRK